MTAFGMADVSSLVLQPQPSFEELQHTAAHMQQLLMAGHRMEALRQAYFAICADASPDLGVFQHLANTSDQLSVQILDRH